MNNHIHGFMQDVVISPFRSFSGGLETPLLRYGMDELLHSRGNAYGTIFRCFNLCYSQ